jgi:RHS repeat-associated protein
VRWRWDFDPFGVLPANGNPSGLGTFTYNLRFPGQFYDAESALHYNYFRDYDPQIGRYIQSDPIGLRGGLNTYAYVDSAPLQFEDPWGLEKQIIFVDDPIVTTGNSIYPTPVYIYDTEAGSWTGPFAGNSAPTQASSTCNNQCPTIQTGNFPYKVSLFPFNPAPNQKLYQAPRLGTVPAIAPNPKNNNQPVIVGVWVHRGGWLTTGSLGCLTISPVDWDNFISNFSSGDTGTVIVGR